MPCSRSSTPVLVLGSRLATGSSATMSVGHCASARAMATRCCCPPDSVSARRIAKSTFANASLFQLQRSAQLPFSGISELAMNASLALIEAAAPQNEIEGALAVQMACAHSAAIAVLARFGSCGGYASSVALASAAARLMRAFSAQVEALRRLRHGGNQYVRVEHVHVNDQGQAVIGNVRTQEGSRVLAKKTCDDHDKQGGPIRQAP